MLLREGHTRSLMVDIRLAGTLAFVAGALNGAGFYAAGLFSANMTGNLSVLADNLALGQWGVAALSALIILVFILGAALSTLLVEMGRKGALPAIYAYVVLLEALIIAGLGFSVLWFPAIRKSAGLILGLSFAMGMQNAATTRISNARVRTTHMSGMITDLGIALALALRGQGAASGPDNRGQLGLYAAAILSFAAGGVAGVMGYERFGGYLLLVIAAFLFLVVIRELHRARRAHEGPGAP